MVSWSQCVVYGLPGFGFGAVTVMISLFLPSLYADQLHVPLTSIGHVTSAVQIFDALSDPLLGYFSDRLKTSWGRRRPFMLLGSWLLAGCFIALFTPPQTGHWSVALTWATIWALLTQLSLTVARVPWLAWGIELSHEYHEKTRLVSLRELMWVLGSFLAAILPLFMNIFTTLNEFTRLTVMAVLWSLLIVLNGTLCFCLLPDTLSVSPTSPSSTVSFLRRLPKLRAAWTLWLSTVLMTMATTSNALLYPFFVRYVLEEEGGLSLLLGLYILLGGFFVPFWAMASKRFDKRHTLAIATSIQAVALLVAFLAVSPGAVGIYSGVIVLAGVSFGGVPVIRFSMLGDVADLLQLQTDGKNDEGKLVAIFDVSSKLAASALISLAFTVIDLSGYKADEMQGASSKLAIRIFYGLVPCILGALSAMVIFFLYPLDRARHAEVLNQLNKANPETLGKPAD
mgnify:CR=1 FL=1